MPRANRPRDAAHEKRACRLPHRAARLGLALAVAALGCESNDRTGPTEVAEASPRPIGESSADDMPPHGRSDEQDLTNAAEVGGASGPTVRPPPLLHRLVPRPAAFVVPDGCLEAHAATAEDALRECRRLSRTGTRFQRRYCVCQRDRLIEVGPDDPVAFYLGCCWSPGETPEEARAECERRRQAGWCEPEGAPDDVVIATGPYTRRGSAHLYESLEVHQYLVPSDTVAGMGAWVGADGEPPCFPHGTIVELEDGPRPIEDVRRGDRVVTSRPGEERATAPVLDVKARTADVVLALELGDRELLVTPEHPILVDDAWIPARAVRAGDALVGLEEPVRVTAVRVIGGERPVRTLRVGTPHRFFAGGVLVHNY